MLDDAVNKDKEINPQALQAAPISGNSMQKQYQANGLTHQNQSHPALHQPIQPNPIPRAVTHGILPSIPLAD